MNLWALPILYSDELIYSGFARYLQSWHYSKAQALFLQYGLNCNNKAVIDHSADLPRLIRAFALSSQKSIRYVLQNHSLLPYYLSFEPLKARQFICEAIKDNCQLGGFNSRLISLTRMLPPSHLRFCDACFDSDAKEVGEPYWHRSHQIPGATVCASHRRLLYKSTVSRQPKGLLLYLAAHTSRCLATFEHIETHTISEEISFQLSQRSSALLKKSLGRPADISTAGYRKILTDLGYRKHKNRIYTDRLDNDFIFFLGGSDSYLCNIKKRPWWHNYFQNIHSTHPPIGHLLLRIFLSKKINELFSSDLSFEYEQVCH